MVSSDARQLGELGSLEALHRRDLNCLKDRSRQRRLAALRSLNFFFKSHLSNLSAERQRSLSPCALPDMTRGPCTHKIGEGCNSAGSACGNPPCYSQRSLSQFFLSHIYKPCIKISSEDTSDDCREIAVDLLGTCIKHLDAEHIERVMLQRQDTASGFVNVQARGETSGMPARDEATVQGCELIPALLNRLQGTPFNESSEEIRCSILNILLFLLRGTACCAVGEPLSDTHVPDVLQEGEDWWTECLLEQPNSCNQENHKTLQRPSTCAPPDPLRETAGAKKSPFETHARAIFRAIANATSDTDARNVQLACLIAVAISERLGAETLRTVSLKGIRKQLLGMRASCQRVALEAEASPKKNKMDYVLRHFGWLLLQHALHALQRQVRAGVFDGRMTEKIVNGLTVLNYEEATCSNRNKLAEVVFQWFRMVPIKFMKRYVSRFLLLLLSCAADEESEALAKRAARFLVTIALPCLIQLRSDFALKAREVQREESHSEEVGFETAHYSPETHPATYSSCNSSSDASAADDEVDEQTDAEEDEDGGKTASAKLTADDIELLELSWSAASGSCCTWPRQNPALYHLEKRFACILDSLPFPFCVLPEPVAQERDRVPELKKSEHTPRQASHAEHSQCHRDEEHQNGADGVKIISARETAAGPAGNPLQMAELALMLRHFALELVQQALTEDSGFVTSPDRWCRSLRTLRLLAALLLACPTVAENSWSAIDNAELIRRILLHLYKVCHHADALAQHQYACTDGNVSNQAAGGSSSLLEYAFLVASSQVEEIMKDVDGAVSTELSASGRISPADESVGRIDSTVESAITQTGAAMRGSGPLPAREIIPRAASVCETYGVDADTPCRILATGALKSCLKIVQEAQNCSATIAAVAAPCEWLVPLAEHVHGTDAELVRAYKQRLSAGTPLWTRNNEGDDGEVDALDASIDAVPPARTLRPDCDPSRQHGGQADRVSDTSKQKTSNDFGRAFYQRMTGDIQSQKTPQKAELCGRPQYAFLLLGSMLWRIRKKRTLRGSSAIQTSRMKVHQNVATSQEDAASNICCDRCKCTSAKVRNCRCKYASPRNAQWAPDDARFCFGIVEQLLYPHGVHWTSEEGGATGAPEHCAFAPEDTLEAPGNVTDIAWSCTDPTASPCMLSFKSGILIARAGQLPQEENPIIPYAASVIPVLLDMCRRLCEVEWGRVLFVLIRLRVEEKASPPLIEDALELLTAYSKQDPAALCHHFLSSWVSGERQMLQLSDAKARADLPNLAGVTENGTEYGDDSCSGGTKSSSFVDAWPPSDPRRLMLLYVLTRLRRLSPRPLSLDDSILSALSQHQQDPHATMKPQSPLADVLCSTQALPGQVHGSEMPHMHLQPESDSSLLKSSTVSRWLPPVLRILARQACPEDVAPSVRVDVLQCTYELYTNPSVHLHGGPYGFLVLEDIIKPNLRWRPGEANAKLRKAALACVDSIITSVGSFLTNTAALACVDSIITSVGSFLTNTVSTDLPGLVAAEDIEGAVYDGGPLVGCMPKSSSLQLTHAQPPGGTPRAIKAVPSSLSRASNLSIVREANRSVACLLNIVHSLLPLLLSCLEDDAQPDTRRMTAVSFSRIFLELEACLRAQREERVISGAETAVTTLGAAFTTLADDEVISDESCATNTASSPTSATEASQKVPAEDPSHIPAAPASGVSLQSKRQKDNTLPGGPASANQQCELLSICSSVYPPLLQRLDDARDTVRHAAAAALCSMLRLLGCLKQYHNRQLQGAKEQEIPQLPPIVLTGDAREKGPWQGVVGDVKKKDVQQVPNFLKGEETQRYESTEAKSQDIHGRKRTPEDLNGGADGQFTQNTRNDLPLKPVKSLPWRWPCLEYVVRGVVTFLDDQDEALVNVIQEVLHLAGALNASFVLQEVQSAAKCCISSERYDAVCEAIQSHLLHTQ